MQRARIRAGLPRNDERLQPHALGWVHHPHRGIGDTVVPTQHLAHAGREHVDAADLHRSVLPAADADAVAALVQPLQLVQSVSGDERATCSG